MQWPMSIFANVHGSVVDVSAERESGEEFNLIETQFSFTAKKEKLLEKKMLKSRNLLSAALELDGNLDSFATTFLRNR